MMSSRGTMNVEQTPTTEILPHHPVASPAAQSPASVVIRCPRCHEMVALPSWAADGDLTECCGLLLRVTNDRWGWQLDRL
jgi:hypothetical protein